MTIAEKAKNRNSPGGWNGAGSPPYKAEDLTQYAPGTLSAAIRIFITDSGMDMALGTNPAPARIIMGPYASQGMGHMGADVIKTVAEIDPLLQGDILHLPAEPKRALESSGA